jgi:hypothetical protein
MKIVIGDLQLTTGQVKRREDKTVMLSVRPFNSTDPIWTEPLEVSIPELRAALTALEETTK